MLNRPAAAHAELQDLSDHLEVKAARRKWNPALHPRDSKGRFIETGGTVRLWGGKLARVVRALPNDRILVQDQTGPNEFNGRRHTTSAKWVSMVARPDGSAPTDNEDKVAEEDEKRIKDPRRGNGVVRDDDGDPDTPNDPHDVDDRGRPIGDDDDPVGPRENDDQDEPADGKLPVNVRALPNRNHGAGARFRDTAALRQHFLDLAERPGQKPQMAQFLRSVAGDDDLLVTTLDGRLIALRDDSTGRWYLTATGTGQRMDAAGDFATPAEALEFGRHLYRSTGGTAMRGGGFDFSEPDLDQAARTWRSPKGENIQAAIKRARQEFDTSRTTPAGPSTNGNAPETPVGEQAAVSRADLKPGDTITVTVARADIEWPDSTRGREKPETATVRGTIAPPFSPGPGRAGAPLLDATITDSDGNEIATRESVRLQRLPATATVSARRDDFTPEEIRADRVRVGDVIAHNTYGHVVTEVRKGPTGVGFTTRNLGGRGEVDGFSLRSGETLSVIPRARRRQEDVQRDVPGRTQQHPNSTDAKRAAAGIISHWGKVNELAEQQWPDGAPEEFRALAQHMQNVTDAPKGADGYHQNAEAMHGALAALDRLDAGSLNRDMARALYRLEERLDENADRFEADSRAITENKRKREAEANAPQPEAPNPAERDEPLKYAWDKPEDLITLTMPAAVAEWLLEEDTWDSKDPDSRKALSEAKGGKNGALKVTAPIEVHHALLEMSAVLSGDGSDAEPNEIRGYNNYAKRVDQAAAELRRRREERGANTPEPETPQAGGVAEGDAPSPDAPNVEPEGQGGDGTVTLTPDEVSQQLDAVRPGGSKAPSSMDDGEIRDEIVSLMEREMANGGELSGVDRTRLRVLEAEEARRAGRKPKEEPKPKPKAPAVDAGGLFDVGPDEPQSMFADPNNPLDRPDDEFGTPDMFAAAEGRDTSRLRPVQTRAPQDLEKGDRFVDAEGRTHTVAEPPVRTSRGRIRVVTEDGREHFLNPDNELRVLRPDEDAPEVPQTSTPEANTPETDGEAGETPGTPEAEAPAPDAADEPSDGDTPEGNTSEDAAPDEDGPAMPEDNAPDTPPAAPQPEGDAEGTVPVGDREPADMDPEEIADEIDGLEDVTRALRDSTDPLELAYRLRAERRLWMLQREEADRWEREPEYDKDGKLVEPSRGSILLDRVGGYGLNQDEARGAVSSVDELPPAKPGGYSDDEWEKIDAEASAAEDYPPTDEQRVIIEGAARRGLDMRVMALAGTGKSTTLKMLSRRMPGKRILYLAFNRSVADEAIEAQQRGEYAKNLTPTTANAYANSMVDRDLLDRLKWPRLNDQQLADRMRWYAPIRAGGDSLSPRRAAYYANKLLSEWVKSDDDDFAVHHLPEELSNRDAVFAAIKPLAEQMWANITDPKAKNKDRDLPLSFDHTVKMWALSRRVPDTDVLFWDEAQDVNPVMEGIVRNIRAAGVQIVAVGDSNQAIYGFRGATDALGRLPADATATLTQTFRFGDAVADAGNRFLRLVGTRMRLKGWDRKNSRIGEIHPGDETMLIARTNAGVVMGAVEGLQAGRKVAVSGGLNDLRKFLEAAEALRDGKRTNHQDLARFNGMGWDTIREEVAAEPSLKQLDSMFKLMERHSEELDTLLDAVRMPRPLVEDDGEHLWVKFSFGDRNFESTKEWLKRQGFGWDGVSKRWGYPPPKKGNHVPEQERGRVLEKVEQYIADRYTAPASGNGGQIVDQAAPHDLLVSTAHKAKGLESERVRIAGDFRGPKETPEGGIDWDTIPGDEELRLAYVAVTRATDVLDTGSLGWVFDVTRGDDPMEEPDGDYTRDWEITDFLAGDRVTFWSEDGESLIPGEVSAIDGVELRVRTADSRTTSITPSRVARRNGQPEPRLDVASPEELDAALRSGQFVPPQAGGTVRLSQAEIRDTLARIRPESANGQDEDGESGDTDDSGEGAPEPATTSDGGNDEESTAPDAPIRETSPADMTDEDMKAELGELEAWRQRHVLRTGEGPHVQGNLILALNPLVHRAEAIHEEQRKRLLAREAKEKREKQKQERAEALARAEIGKRNDDGSYPVAVDGEDAGSVAQLARKWRYTNDNGDTSPDFYSSRAEAVAALVRNRDVRRANADEDDRRERARSEAPEGWAIGDRADVAENDIIRVPITRTDGNGRPYPVGWRQPVRVNSVSRNDNGTMVMSFSNLDGSRSDLSPVFLSHPEHTFAWASDRTRPEPTPAWHHELRVRMGSISDDIATLQNHEGIDDQDRIQRLADLIRHVEDGDSEDLQADLRRIVDETAWLEEQFSTPDLPYDTWRWRSWATAAHHKAQRALEHPDFQQGSTDEPDAPDVDRPSDDRASRAQGLFGEGMNAVGGDSLPEMQELEDRLGRADSAEDRDAELRDIADRLDALAEQYELAGPQGELAADRFRRAARIARGEQDDRDDPRGDDNEDAPESENDEQQNDDQDDEENSQQRRDGDGGAADPDGEPDGGDAGTPKTPEDGDSADDEGDGPDNEDDDQDVPEVDEDEEQRRRRRRRDRDRGGNGGPGGPGLPRPNLPEFNIPSATGDGGDGGAGDRDGDRSRPRHRDVDSLRNAWRNGEGLTPAEDTPERRAHLAELADREGLALSPEGGLATYPEPQADGTTLWRFAQARNGTNLPALTLTSDDPEEARTLAGRFEEITDRNGDPFDWHQAWGPASVAAWRDGEGRNLPQALRAVRDDYEQERSGAFTLPDDLTTLSDPELEAAYRQGLGPEDELRVIAEMDLRDGYVDERIRAAVPDTPPTDAEEAEHRGRAMDDALGFGDTDITQPAPATPGRLRREFDALDEERFQAAMEATGGRMLSPKAEADGIDPRDVFSGGKYSNKRAKELASPELSLWLFGDDEQAGNGRLTYPQYRQREADRVLRDQFALIDDARYRQAVEFTNGYFFKREYKYAGLPFDELELFSGGSLSARDRWRQYASDELVEWYDLNGGRLTFNQFKQQYRDNDRIEREKNEEEQRRAAEEEQRAAADDAEAEESSSSTTTTGSEESAESSTPQLGPDEELVTVRDLKPGDIVQGDRSGDWHVVLYDPNDRTRDGQVWLHTWSVDGEAGYFGFNNPDGPIVRSTNADLVDRGRPVREEQVRRLADIDAADERRRRAEAQRPTRLTRTAPESDPDIRRSRRPVTDTPGTTVTPNQLTEGDAVRVTGRNNRGAEVTFEGRLLAPPQETTARRDGVTVPVWRLNVGEAGDPLRPGNALTIPRDGEVTRLDDLAPHTFEQPSPAPAVPEETPEPEPVGGRRAHWARVGDLVPGDMVRIDGTTKKGRLSTRAGYVYTAPVRVEVIRSGRTTQMWRTWVTENSDGTGASGNVFTTLNATAARAEAPEDIAPGSPDSGAQAAVRAGDLPDEIPTDRNGRGLFPGSTVTGPNDREGTVIGATDTTVSVRLADDDDDTELSPTSLTVTDSQRPDGWTASGQRVRAGHVVTDTDGALLGPVDRVDGDSVTINTTEGTVTRNAGDLRVAGEVRDDVPATAPVTGVDEPAAADLKDGDVVVLELDGALVTVAITSPPSRDGDRVTLQYADTTTGEIGEIDVDARAVLPRAQGPDGGAPDLGPDDAPEPDDDLIVHPTPQAIDPVTGPTVDPELDSSDRDIIGDHADGPDDNPDAHQAAVRITADLPVTSEQASALATQLRAAADPSTPEGRAAMRAANRLDEAAGRTPPPGLDRPRPTNVGQLNDGDLVALPGDTSGAPVRIYRVIDVVDAPGGIRSLHLEDSDGRRTHRIEHGAMPAWQLPEPEPDPVTPPDVDETDATPDAPNAPAAPTTPAAPDASSTPDTPSVPVARVRPGSLRAGDVIDAPVSRSGYQFNGHRRLTIISEPHRNGWWMQLTGMDEEGNVHDFGLHSGRAVNVYDRNRPTPALPPAGTPRDPNQVPQADVGRIVSAHARSLAARIIDAAIAGTEPPGDIHALREQIAQRLTDDALRDARQSTRRDGAAALDAAGITDRDRVDAQRRLRDARKQAHTDTVRAALRTINDLEPLPDESDEDLAARARDLLRLIPDQVAGRQSTTDPDADPDVTRAVTRHADDAVNALLQQLQADGVDPGDAERIVRILTQHMAGSRQATARRIAARVAAASPDAGRQPGLLARIIALLIRMAKRLALLVREGVRKIAEKYQTARERLARLRAFLGRMARRVRQWPESRRLARLHRAVNLPDADGDSLAARISHWAGLMPEPGRFGQAQRRVTLWRPTTWARLAAGRLPDRSDRIQWTPDRAADGGPGLTALRHTAALRAAGSDVDQDVTRRLSAALGDDFGDEPHGTLQYADDYVAASERRLVNLQAARSGATIPDDPDLEVEITGARAELAAARREYADLRARYAAAVPDAVAAALADIRDMGPEGTAALVFGADTNPDAERAVRGVQRLIPRAWLNTPEVRRLTAVDGTQGRYEPEGPRITVADLADEGLGTAGHALAQHLARHLGDLDAAQRAFWFTQTHIGRPGARRPSALDRLLRRWQQTQPETGDSLARSIQAMFSGDWYQDDDLRAFLLGLMATR
ncbi:UvrD-helicase domain-containing protein [Streptomyces xantholiticus]|uniref:UvrD-helicase domain-containing protein n=1 Tax=Streptomyces xantholiticus TaxID=68285 RepID=A0ABV1V178_9ACTN